MRTIKVILRDLRVDPQRAVLTVAGVIIGIASVSLLLTSGEVAKSFVQSEIDRISGRLGTVRLELSDLPMADADNPMVLARPNLGGAGGSLRDADGLSIRHVNWLVDNAEKFGALATSPTIELEVGAVRVQGVRDPVIAAVQGVGAAIRDIRTLPLRAGRFLTGEDVERHRRVAVVNDSFTADPGFPADSLIGRRVRLDRGSADEVVVIVGVVGSGIADRGELYLPWTLLEATVGEGSASTTQVLARLPDVQDAQDFRERLGSSFFLGFGQRLSVIEESDGRATLERVIVSAQAFLGLIAGVGLFTGFLGIANLMYLSIRGRVVEIAIRRACGATASDIRNLFLVEAGTLALVGAVVGVYIALILVSAGVEIAREILRTDLVVFRPPIGLLILAVSLTAGLGVIAGYRPAVRASRVDVIDALRSG